MGMNDCVSSRDALKQNRKKQSFQFQSDIGFLYGENSNTYPLGLSMSMEERIKCVYELGNNIVKLKIL